MSKIEKNPTTKIHPPNDRFSSIRNKIARSFIQMSVVTTICAGSFLNIAKADVIVNSVQERDRAIDQIKASHFLSQATFGPTWAEINSLADEIDRVGERRAFNEWIDTQMGLSASRVDPYMVGLQRGNGRPIKSDQDPLVPGFQGLSLFRDHATWTRTLKAKDQLRQRMSYALSQILVVGRTSVLRNANGWRGTSIYNDILINKAFGNYQDILEDITYSPAMGEWLDSAKNQKTSTNPVTGNIRFPDENFAREFLQLFTVGVFKLNEGGQVLKRDGNPIVRSSDVPAELYDNETIQEFAKVFTGLTFKNRPGENRSFLKVFYNFTSPMVMDNNFHEPGRKTLLRGVRTPGGAVNGNRDIRLAIQNAFNDPNCPPFVSRLLIQRFTTSNPSVDYVRDVVRAFKGTGSSSARGDLSKVVRAILMHPEARQSLSITTKSLSNGRWRVRVADKDRDHGSLREPYIQLTSMLRAFNILSKDQRGDGSMRFRATTAAIGQFPMDSPSVFNFYLPDHQPIGRISRRNLVAPEFEIATPTSVHNLVNVFYATLADERSNSNRRQFQNRFGREGNADIWIKPVLHNTRQKTLLD